MKAQDREKSELYCMTHTLREERLAIIGAGAMGSALVRGFLKHEVVSVENAVVSDPLPEMLEWVQEQTGVRTTTDNVEAVRSARIVILAVKPAVVESVLTQISGSLTTDQLLISVAGGIATGFIEARVPPGVPVVRVMPNTPALVGEMAAAIALGTHATRAHEALVRDLFGSLGLAVTVEEQLMAAVTGLSGSGPAYVYLFIEALADGGVRQGLPRKVALQLAAQTVLGAARMVLETGQHPGELKDLVTSPGGTTIAGLHELERGAFRAAVMNAVEAATARCKSLS